MVASRAITVDERRARLARRHRLAPRLHAGDVVDAARSMVCLHGTDPATVYLSAWARVDGMNVADMERALYVDRSVVKQLAMRRTLFVFPRGTLSLAQAAAGNRVAAAERRRLIRDVEKAGLQADGDRWLATAEREVLAALADGREATSSELRAEIPELEGSISYGEGKSWGGRMSVGPRVLTVLSAAGEVVRGSNVGGWTTSRPRWSSLRSWLGEELAAVEEQEGVAGLVQRWLRAFGPGTENDIKWWLGSTLTVVRRALAELGAVEVDLDGQTGYLLPDDLDAVEPGRAMGDTAAAAGPDHHGLERARVVPRPVQGAAVRHRRERRAYRLVGWTDRRRLAPDRVGRRRPPAARGHRRGGQSRRRQRSSALDRVVGWHPGPAQVPVTAVEGVGAGSCRGIGQRRKKSRGGSCRRARDLVRGASGGPARSVGKSKRRSAEMPACTRLQTWPLRPMWCSALIAVVGDPYAMRAGKA
jgi:hypothetical protein